MVMMGELHSSELEEAEALLVGLDSAGTAEDSALGGEVGAEPSESESEPEVESEDSGGVVVGAEPSEPPPELELELGPVPAVPVPSDVESEDSGSCAAPPCRAFVMSLRCSIVSVYTLLT